MEVVKATYSLSPDSQVFSLSADRSVGRDFEPDRFDTDAIAYVFQEVDDQGHETGRVAGVEIVGFRDFREYDAIPDLGVLFKLPGWEPLPLDDLIRRVQKVTEKRQATAA